MFVIVIKCKSDIGFIGWFIEGLPCGQCESPETLLVNEILHEFVPKLITKIIKKQIFIEIKHSVIGTLFLLTKKTIILYL